MKHALLIALALCLSGAALAQQDLGPLVTAQPVVWQGARISVGDSRAQVRQVTGRAPDRDVVLRHGESLRIGQQWMYFGRDAEPGRLLWVELIGGRVSRVWTETIQRS
ncbi:MAG TPA: hypothetical protein VGE51_05870 [Fontimonas sp.]